MLAVAETSRRPLTICAVGSSRSTHVVARVQCFARRGHRVYLITEAQVGIEGVTELVPSEDEVGVLRLVNAAFRRRLPASRLLALLLSIPRLIRQCKPDIVHVHFAYSMWAWMAVVAGHHPLVVSVMGGDILFEEQGSPTRRGKWLTVQLLRQADVITSKSEFLVKVLEHLGDFRAKTIKVVWGVDLKLFRRIESAGLRSSLGLNDRDFVILSARILQKFYNVHLIVEAMPRIIAACPRARLVITEYAADREYKREIEQRVKELRLDDVVVFVGQIPHAEMPRYYSLADVSVGVPSSDGLPQTLLEAMACGVPNVLSRLRRYEELISHEESGYFVDISPEAIAEGVVRLLRDCDLRTRVAERGLEIVTSAANFDREVDRVEAMYYDLLSTRRSRTGAVTRARVLQEVVRYWVES